MTGLRRYLYQRQIIGSYKAPVPVISVGNLRVGGTGKTPLINYLAQYFTATKRRPAILSRGFGRQSKGYRHVTAQSPYSEVGDEARMQRLILGNDVGVHVCESRKKGIQTILKSEPPPAVILLDDAYQHLRVRPDLQILLTTYDQPFYLDHIWPWGMLRESPHAAEVADLVIVTKCPPAMTLDQAEEVKRRIKTYSGEKTVLFSTIKYGQPRGVNEKSFQGNSIALVTGIAEDQSLASHLSNTFDLLHHFRYPDHYPFKKSDIRKLVSFCEQNQASLMTTEKDLPRLEVHAELEKIPLLVQPISVQFLPDNEEVLHSLIEESLSIQPSGQR